jgi:hypothetical protein
MHAHKNVVPAEWYYCRGCRRDRFFVFYSDCYGLRGWMCWVCGWFYKKWHSSDEEIDDNGE